MDMLVRGRHVITDPAVGDPGVLEDGAVAGLGLPDRRGRGLGRAPPAASPRAGGGQRPAAADAGAGRRPQSRPGAEPDPEGRAQRLPGEQPARLGVHAGLRPGADGRARRLAPPAERLHDDPSHGLRHGGPAGARPVGEGHPHLPAQRDPARLRARGPERGQAGAGLRGLPRDAAAGPPGLRRAAGQRRRQADGGGVLRAVRITCTGASRPRTRACCSRRAGRRRAPRASSSAPRRRRTGWARCPSTCTACRRRSSGRSLSASTARARLPGSTSWASSTRTSPWATPSGSARTTSTGSRRAGPPSRAIRAATSACATAWRRSTRCTGGASTWRWGSTTRRSTTTRTR